jgi:hypothetical protein
MKLAVILTIIFPNICFASPFDLAGEQYEEAVIEETEEIETGGFESEEVGQEQNKIFQSTNKAEIVAVNIKNGKRYQIKVNVGDNAKIDNINLKLLSCMVEKDNFYKKISLANTIINGEKIILTSDFNLQGASIEDKLIILNCQ